MNKVILIGYVGSDPRMKMVDSSPVAEFRLATNERRTQRKPDGTVVELPEFTEWHNIVLWRRAAEFAEKYIRKGTHLLVEGKLRTRRYQDQNAIERSVTEIYVDTFELLPK